MKFSRLRKDKIPSESKCKNTIETMVQRGYITKVDGSLYPTVMGEDWFYSDEWASEERKMGDSEE